FSGKPQNSSNDLGDDIPVAVRDTPDATPKIWLPTRIVLIGGVAVFVLLALISGFLFFLTAPKKIADSQPSVTTSTPTPTTESGNVNTVLGHFPYPEAPESELVTISAN
ncbi:MAG: D-alanyl-D-alanine carboxypeptidase, partial [Nostoc sp.]